MPMGFFFLRQTLKLSSYTTTIKCLSSFFFPKYITVKNILIITQNVIKTILFEFYIDFDIVVYDMNE